MKNHPSEEKIINLKTFIIARDGHHYREHQPSKIF